MSVINLGGGGSGSGFKLGATPSLFGDVTTSKASAEAALTSQSGDSTWLAVYEDNPALNVMLQYEENGEPAYEYRSRVGGSWVKSSLIVPLRGKPGEDGEDGEDGTSLKIQYSVTGDSGWEDTLDASLHKYWRWSVDGGYNWSPDYVKYSADTSGGLPDPYAWGIDNDGKLTITKLVEGAPRVIYRADEEGTYLTESVSTGTGSLHLGEIHSIGSGGENVTFINEDSQVAYYPAWAGVDVNGTETYDPTIRVHSALQNFPSDPSGFDSTREMPYDLTLVGAANTVFFNITIAPAEDYSGRLNWHAERLNGKEVASFYFNDTLTTDDLYTVQFKYPLWGFAGQTVNLKIYKENGELLRVRPNKNISTSEPYRVAKLRMFTDEEILHMNNPKKIVEALDSLQDADKLQYSSLGDKPIASTDDLGMIKIGSTLEIDSDGIVNSIVAPAKKVVAADEAEMLALSKIDNLYIVSRVDLEQIFYLAADEDPSKLSNWVEGPSTRDNVTSFNGRDGIVEPERGDYTQDLINTVHDDTGNSGRFGIDNNGIYWEDLG